MQVSLHTAALHYGGGLVLHTASSGSIGLLDALYLRLEEDGLVGVGEVRTNIAYLNGLPSAHVVAQAVSAVGTVDWASGAERLLAGMADRGAPLCAPVRALIDCALHDLGARKAGVDVATWLGARLVGPVAWPSNQTLFWSSDDELLSRAEAYVGRGFSDLKLRVGIACLEDDLRRLDLLRRRFGPGVTIAVDANGQWTPEQAEKALWSLADRGVRYVEQPIAAGDWPAVARLAAATPLPIMLDESVRTEADIERICMIGGNRLAAHLKLVKLGGITPTVAAARRLAAAGIPFMIGQMNEGAGATAAALQVAAATRPAWAELYGADGLIDDPVHGLFYGDGIVTVAAGHGLGISLDIARTHTIKEL